MDLQHHTRECTGVWKHRTETEQKYWYCPVCGARHAANGETSLAALRENALGHLMRDLVRRGVREKKGDDGATDGGPT